MRLAEVWLYFNYCIKAASADLCIISTHMGAGRHKELGLPLEMQRRATVKKVRFLDRGSESCR